MQKPLPVWTGEAMEVPCPNYLQDAWDASDSFAEAFVSVYQAVMDAYDAAHAKGQAPSQVDERNAEYEHERFIWFRQIPAELVARYEHVEKVILSQVPSTTRRAFATEQGIKPEVLDRLIELNGIDWPLFNYGKDARRLAVEALIRDGVTKPSAIVAALAESHPEWPAPHRNLISSWKCRMTDGT